MRLILFYFCFLSALCLSDYAWIPKEQNLSLRTGWEFFKSDTNFDLQGKRVPLSTNGSLSSLLQNRFFLESEYGLAERWAGILRTSVLNAQINSDSTGQRLLGNSGLFDTALGFKWQFLAEKPVFALETALILPPYSNNGLSSDELALGDGVSGVLLQTHAGMKTGRFSFSLSPGLLFRFGRFSHQAVWEAAVSAVINKFFLRFYQNGIFSLTKDPGSFLDSVNPETGSGGSYSRLSISPDLITVGARLGMHLSSKFRLETFVSQSVWGQTAADGFKVGLALVSVFDFFVPDTREPIHEVPLQN